MEARTVVPCPGWLWTLAVPPTRAMRSRMLCSPIPPRAPWAMETLAPVAHLEDDVAVIAAERQLGGVDAGVTADVAQRLLRDAEEREVGLLVEPGGPLVHRGRDGEPLLAEALDQPVEGGPEPEGEAGRVEAVTQLADGVGDVVDLALQRREPRPGFLAGRCGFDGAEVVAQMGEMLDHVVVQLAPDVGPFGFLRAQQLLGVLAVQRDGPALGEHEKRGHGAKHHGYAERAGDEEGPEGAAGTGHSMPVVIAMSESSCKPARKFTTAMACSIWSRSDRDAEQRLGGARRSR